MRIYQKTEPLSKQAGSLNVRMSHFSLAKYIQEPKQTFLPQKERTTKGRQWHPYVERERAPCVAIAILRTKHRKRRDLPQRRHRKNMGKTWEHQTCNTTRQHTRVETSTGSWRGARSFPRQETGVKRLLEPVTHPHVLCAVTTYGPIEERASRKWILAS